MTCEQHQWIRWVYILFLLNQELISNYAPKQSVHRIQITLDMSIMQDIIILVQIASENEKVLWKISYPFSNNFKDREMAQ